MSGHQVVLNINGSTVEGSVDPRLTLADFIRDQAGLTGTKLGCEHGVCGACTVLVNGEAVRSCLMFAVQASGTEVTTVEGFASNGDLHPLQQAFADKHGLQCGFCTPGMLISSYAFLKENRSPTEDEIRVALSGNICRCTGYQGIVDAVQHAVETDAAAVPLGESSGSPSAHNAKR
ncbi:MAG TPA: (2Fe-2S)-binding protein [Solirubrobacteraceae bacterium]